MTAIGDRHILENGLNPRQMLFVKYYMECMNANQAAEQAGYKRGVASSVISTPVVKAAIAEAMKDIAMAPSEIISRLTRIAQADMGEIMDVDESGYPRVNLKKAKEYGRLGMIQEISYDAQGMPKVKLMSQLDAMEKLAKINAMFTERVEINTTTTVDINVSKRVMNVAMADPALLEQLGRLADEVASKGSVVVPARQLDAGPTVKNVAGRNPDDASVIPGTVL